MLLVSVTGKQIEPGEINAWEDLWRPGKVLERKPVWKSCISWQTTPAPGMCSQIKSSEDMLAGHHHASLIKHALDSVEQINQYFLAAFPTGSFPEAQLQDKEL